MSHPCCVAAVQDKDWFRATDWLKRHEDLLKRRDSLRDTRVVFLGDSITEGWFGDGKATWDKHFAEFRPLNLGIGGDETSHILWRIEQGELDGLAPKALVLLIGTNNIGNVGHTGRDTAQGVKLIIQRLREKLPTTKVLLAAVFPRDHQPGTPFRKEIAELNSIIAKVHDGKMVHYVDYASTFLCDGGKLPNDVSPDFLHLSAKGYDLWAKAMVPKLQELAR